MYMVELLPYTWASLEWMLVTMMPGAGYWIIRISRGLQELLRPAQGSNEGKHGKHLLIKSHKITPNLCQSSPKYLTNQTGLARKSPHLIEWFPIKTSIKCGLPYMFMIFLLFTRWVPSQPLLRLITDSTDPYIIYIYIIIIYIYIYISIGTRSVSRVPNWQQSLVLCLDRFLVRDHQETS